MGDRTRRQMLAVASTTTVGAIAGCMGSGDGDPDGATDDDGNETTGDENGGDESGGPDGGTDESGSTAQTGTILGDITVENLDETGHTVDVIVEFGGEIEEWTTETLETSGDSTTLERNWPSEPGSFSVVARLDGESVREVTPADWNDPDCFNLFISVRSDDGVTMASGTSGGPCGSGDADDDDATEAE